MASTEELVKKLESFKPIQTESDDYLEELFVFLEMIIHGDDIEQYRANAYWSRYAEEAIKRITKLAQENGLQEFEQEKNRILEELRSEKERLTKEIETLKVSKDWCVSQNGALQNEIGIKRNELSDIDNKIKEKELRSQELGKINKFLEESIRGYNKEIDKVSNNGGFSVVWLPISEDDPIYNTNNWTVREHFELLKLRYMQYTGASLEQCEKDFEDNMPNYKELIEFIEYYSNPRNKYTRTIKAILKNDEWDDKTKREVALIESMLKNMKMPSYIPNVTRKDQFGIDTSEISDNINQALREIQLKRKILESVARQRILESEIATLMNILRSVVPNDADLKSLLNGYNALGLLQTDEDYPLSREIK